MGQIAKNCIFAGYNDWHLPTIDELKSIIKKDKSPSINHSAFPNAPKDWFWSSSPYAYYSNGAWFVDFGDGYVDGYGKAGSYHVRLVRGGQ